MNSNVANHRKINILWVLCLPSANGRFMALIVRHYIIIIHCTRYDFLFLLYNVVLIPILAFIVVIVFYIALVVCDHHLFVFLVAIVAIGKQLSLFLLWSSLRIAQNSETVTLSYGLNPVPSNPRQTLGPPAVAVGEAHNFVPGPVTEKVVLDDGFWMDWFNRKS